MSYINDIFTEDEETLIRYVEPIFMRKGHPTEEYKIFLLDLAQFIISANSEMRQAILIFLMRCEEPAYISITGIISVKKTDPQFYSYSRVIHAIYGEQCSFMTADKIDICNTILVNMIQQLEAGCSYRPCYRNNKLHKECMHTRLQFEEL
jgi:hypothetical protein